MWKLKNMAGAMGILQQGFFLCLLFCASVGYGQNYQFSIEGGQRVINYKYHDPHTRLETNELHFIPNIGISLTGKIVEGLWLGAGVNLLPTEIYPIVLSKEGLGGGSHITFGPNLDFNLLARYEVLKLGKKWKIDLGLSASYCKNFDSPDVYRVLSTSSYTAPDGSSKILEERYDLHRMRAFDIFIKPEMAILYKLDERFDIGLVFQNPISFSQTMKADIYFRDDEHEEWKYASIRTNGSGRHYNLRILYHFW